jgi:hypothetical protein
MSEIDSIQDDINTSIAMTSRGAHQVAAARSETLEALRSLSILSADLRSADSKILPNDRRLTHIADANIKASERFDSAHAALEHATDGSCDLDRASALRLLGGVVNKLTGNPHPIGQEIGMGVRPALDEQIGMHMVLLAKIRAGLAGVISDVDKLNEGLTTTSNQLLYVVGDSSDTLAAIKSFNETLVSETE